MTDLLPDLPGPVDCHQAELLLGVLVLGVIDPGERPAVEAHLAGCPRCTATLAELAVLPGLLAQVDPEQAALGLPPLPVGFTDRVLAAGRTSADRARAARRRWALVGVAAAAVVLLIVPAVFVLGLLRGSPTGTDTAAEPTVVSTVDPATGVQAEVTLVPTPTGTELALALRGVVPGEHCRLVAIDRAGTREVAATWVASYEGQADITGATSLTRANIASLEVVRLDGRPLARMIVPVANA
jgi:hypothetical protein